MSDVLGIVIRPDKTVEEVAIRGYSDLQDAVQGLIEPVTLRDGSTMYVNEEFRLGQFGPEDFNSIASDLAGLGGRVDLLILGILGPVVVVGPVNAVGEDTDITTQARKWIKRVHAEAV